VAQVLYVSATPAQFEMENSVVGNTGYIPHKRERIGEDVKSMPALDCQRQTTLSCACRQRRAGGEVRCHHQGPGTLIVEQIIRPTGLLDPVITIKPLQGPDRRDHRALPPAHRDAASACCVTTLTKRTAEDLTDYLRNLDLQRALPAQRHRRHRARGDPARRCARAIATSSSASTCCAKASICPR